MCCFAVLAELVSKQNSKQLFALSIYHLHVRKKKYVQAAKIILPTCLQ